MARSTAHRRVPGPRPRAGDDQGVRRDRVGWGGTPAGGACGGAPGRRARRPWPPVPPGGAGRAKCEAARRPRGPRSARARPRGRPAARTRDRAGAGGVAVRHPARATATSRAVWNRSAGFFASSRAMMSHSHCGVSGMISRIGRGVSSATRFSTATVLLAPERRPAGGHLVQHAAQAEQVGPLVERLALGLLRGHVHRRAGDDPALRRCWRRRPPGPARSR